MDTSADFASQSESDDGVWCDDGFRFHSRFRSRSLPDALPIVIELCNTVRRLRQGDNDCNENVLVQLYGVNHDLRCSFVRPAQLHYFGKSVSFACCTFLFTKLQYRELYDGPSQCLFCAPSIAYAVVDLAAPVMIFRRFRFYDYNVTIQHNFPLVNGTLFHRVSSNGIRFNLSPNIERVAIVEKLAVYRHQQILCLF